MVHSLTPWPPAPSPILGSCITGVVDSPQRATELRSSVLPAAVHELTETHRLEHWTKLSSKTSTNSKQNSEAVKLQCDDKKSEGIGW
jgi:hypothetical protein